MESTSRRFLRVHNRKNSGVVEVVTPAVEQSEAVCAHEIPQHALSKRQVVVPGASQIACGPIPLGDKLIPCAAGVLSK